MQMLHQSRRRQGYTRRRVYTLHQNQRSTGDALQEMYNYLFWGIVALINLVVFLTGLILTWNMGWLFPVPLLAWVVLFLILAALEGMTLIHLGLSQLDITYQEQKKEPEPKSVTADPIPVYSYEGYGPQDEHSPTPSYPDPTEPQFDLQM